MHRIAVSILSADRLRLTDEVRRVVAAGADAIHLNVIAADDRPNVNLGHLACAEMRAHCSVPIHVHLRVPASDALIERFAEAGADLLILQAAPGQDTAALLRRVRQAGLSTGLAFGPSDPLDALPALMAGLDLVHVSCAAHHSVVRGFEADSLAQISRVRQRVEAARATGAAPRLQVDGDIGPANIAQVAAAGADDIVIGRALFGSGDWAATIGGLRHDLSTADAVRAPA